MTFQVVVHHIRALRQRLLCFTPKNTSKGKVTNLSASVVNISGPLDWTIGSPLFCANCSSAVDIYASVFVTIKYGKRQDTLAMYIYLLASLLRTPFHKGDHTLHTDSTCKYFSHLICKVQGSIYILGLAGIPTFEPFSIQTSDL
ncbi:hypothetical protein ACQJBY_063057 [Aegilops geniculata]